MIIILQMIVSYENILGICIFHVHLSSDILFTKVIEIISTHEQEKQQNNVGSKW